MKTLNIKITGLTPILLHNNQVADPLNIYKKALSPLTSKRKKTDSDEILICRLEWEAGLYVDENGNIVIPGVNIERMLLDAGTKAKNGPKIKTGVRVDANNVPLNFGQNGFQVKNHIEKPENLPNPELNDLYEQHADRRLAKVSGKSTIIRTRPRFDKWSLEFRLLYDEDLIDLRTILETLKVAEMQVGLGDYRPGSPRGGRYGKFEVTEIAEIN